MKDNELWTDFVAMLKDIRDNYPLKVEQDDLPLDNIIGYKSNTDGKVWRIKVSDVEISIKSKNLSFDTIISTEFGRKTLLETLNQGK